MFCISHDETDPYFNLAAEEYVLKHFSEDCFMLWRNRPAIIVGKHQNTLSEINLEYVRQNHIPVVRRLSGGGTVFHDLGNLNFTFIMSGEPGKLVDFRKFTKPILEVLAILGVEARFEGRNDLTIAGRKFSGNAEHVFRNRVLHHGTLLFSSSISDLGAALKVNPLKYKDKAVKSVRSRVTNISAHLEQAMDVLAFRDRIMEYVLETFPEARLYDFSGEDEEHIRRLAEEKYATWAWNFGYSPAYSFRKNFSGNLGSLECRLEVEKGVIREARITGDSIHEKDFGRIEGLLTGIPHDYEQIRKQLEGVPWREYFPGLPFDSFIAGLF